MRKFYSYAAALVAILATAACSQKELNPAPESDSQSINVRIHGNVLQTRTGVDYDSAEKVHHPYWNEGDKIGVFFDDFGSKTKLDAVLANTKADKSSEAEFSAENVKLSNGTTLGEEGRIYSFYPSAAFQSEGVVVADKAVRVNLKAMQEPSAVDTFDPEADILVGQPSDYLFDEEYLCADIAFARVMSIVKVTLRAGNECPANLAVNSFTMTAPTGTILTGRAKLSLAALYGDASPIMDWTVKNNSVTANYRVDFHPVIGGTENTVYVVVNPTSIASGKIVFNIDTDDYTIEKTVNLTKELTFPQSNVANISLTIDGSNCAPKVAETRILVEGFDKMVSIEDNKTKPAASTTGVKGTGVTESLIYEFSNNSDVRNNNNGKGNGNPFLWIGAPDNGLTISKVAISNESTLKLSIVAKTTQQTADVTVKYKESSADTWNIASGTILASTSSISTTQYVTFDVSSSVTSLDIQIIGSAGYLVVDDIVLERFVDTRETLANPTNVVASVDVATPNKINVSWDAVEHADEYEVILSASEEDDVVLETATNSVVATGLAYETEYSIKVKAVTTDAENYLDSEYANAASTVTTGTKPAGLASWVGTAFDDLKEGDQVVIVSSKGASIYAMGNNNGTGSAPGAFAVTYSDNQLINTPDEKTVWYVGVDDDNRIFYSKQDKSAWLYCTNANNGLRVGTNSNKTFTLDKGYLKHIGTSRYVGVYNTTDWRCYSLSNGNIASNIADQTFSFFVKTGGSEPEQTTDPTQLYDIQDIECSAHSETSLTFTWSAVENASGYKVSVDGGNTYGEIQNETSFVWSSLKGSTSYTIYVKAIGDGINYTDSNVAHATQTTDASSSVNQSDPVVLMFTSTSNATNGTYKASVAQGDGSASPAWTSGELRMYANNTLTISTTGNNMTRIEIDYHKQGTKAYATASASIGNYADGGESTSNTDTKTDTWTGSANSVVITLGDSGQRIVESIRIY